MEDLINELDTKISDLYGLADWEYNYTAEDLMTEINQLLADLRKASK